MVVLSDHYRRLYTHDVPPAKAIIVSAGRPLDRRLCQFKVKHRPSYVSYIGQSPLVILEKYVLTVARGEDIKEVGDIVDDTRRIASSRL